MGPKKITFDFFTRTSGVVDDQKSQEKVNNATNDFNDTQPQIDDDTPMEDSPRIEVENDEELNSGKFKLDSLVTDPGIRPSIMAYPSNQRGEIRREYIRLGPYQIRKSKYPLSASGSKGNRSFQAAWFDRFWWLEYFQENDAAYCFPCYLFIKKPIGRVGSDRFTALEFNTWEKVNSGKGILVLTTRQPREFMGEQGY
ncbi:uncharacterized protein [Rutidosis leptorrhynchoides]|uniref:uncharacterized protein n=1 Tax=Rutidosis leptorrhynchoides TaxID=125765 RepID=UPI003A99CFAB